MIKQINVSNMQKFESQLMKAQSEGYTHVVPYANEIMIYQSMLDAVQLYPKSIVVDYTVDGQYKNDCHYFGQSSMLAAFKAVWKLGNCCNACDLLPLNG